MFMYLVMCVSVHIAVCITRARFRPWSAECIRVIVKLRNKRQNHPGLLKFIWKEIIRMNDDIDAAQDVRSKFNLNILHMLLCSHSTKTKNQTFYTEIWSHEEYRLIFWKITCLRTWRLGTLHIFVKSSLSKTCCE